jgi:LacI family transcriptional regulator
MVVYVAGQHNSQGWERRYISRLSGTLTDGTILVTPTVIDVASTQPVVAVDPHVGGSTLPTVDAQNFEGARAMTEHLLALGHRRIAFLAGRPDLESARRREAGYRAALEAAGVAFDPDLVLVGGFTDVSAAAPARELLTRTPRPTAIFAANDQSAIQTMRTAAELGIRVPDDVSVAGFDNTPDSALTSPPLTTVDQSIQALGREAVRLLLELIDDPGRNDPDDPIHITLPTALVIRSTTARPRS